MRLFTHMNNETFHDADLMLQQAEFSSYEDFEKRYGPFSDRKKIHRAFRIVTFYYEAIGMLLYRKLIEGQMVWDVFTIKYRWEKVAPIIKHLRKELNEPRYFEWFEYLYNWYTKQEKLRKTRKQPIHQTKP